MYKLTAMKESPFTYIVFALWWLTTKALFMILYTLVILIVVLFISMFLGLIALFNFFTGGALNNLVLCQTSPTAWYEVPNYHLGNRFERSLFCKSPCLQGYYPDDATGEFCQRLPKGQPSFCPQAEAMRLYQKKAGMQERHVFAEYNPLTDYTFTLSSPNEKENRYKYHFVNKQKFLDTCNRNMGEYTKVSKDLCTNLDAIEKLKLNGVTKKEINRLKDVCNQGFCNSRSRYFFCGEFGENEEESRGNKLIKEVVLLSLYAIVFMIILFYTYQIIMSI